MSFDYMSRFTVHLILISATNSESSDRYLWRLQDTLQIDEANYFTKQPINFFTKQAMIDYVRKNHGRLHATYVEQDANRITNARGESMSFKLGTSLGTSFEVTRIVSTTPQESNKVLWRLKVAGFKERIFDSKCLMLRYVREHHGELSADSVEHDANELDGTKERTVSDKRMFNVSVSPVLGNWTVNVMGEDKKTGIDFSSKNEMVKHIRDHYGRIQSYYVESDADHVIAMSMTRGETVSKLTWHKDIQCHYPRWTFEFEYGISLVVEEVKFNGSFTWRPFHNGGGNDPFTNTVPMRQWSYGVDTVEFAKIEAEQWAKEWKEQFIREARSQTCKSEFVQRYDVKIHSMDDGERLRLTLRRSGDDGIWHFDSIGEMRKFMQAREDTGPQMPDVIEKARKILKIIQQDY